MSSLANKRILLGVTGGIAAYKSAELVRSLIKCGADVRVVMTAGAQEFITPLTLQALSGNVVHTSLLDCDAEAAMGHIELARWADLILVAPASANFIARLAAGEGSDLLSTLCLASKAPQIIAPAMNQQMWAADATQANIATLKSRAVLLIGPASGEQACGDVGLGRMEEPQEIASFCESQFKRGTLAGKKVVITAGPTREAIDPVRYISNHSSGKMGYALALAAQEAGAQVVLISGPVNIAAPERVQLVNVLSANDMLEASLEASADADIFIGAAAVADFRAANVAEQKLKKTSAETMELTLHKNADVIQSVAVRYPNLFMVGFAAETEYVLANAKAKLKRKQLDMVIANDVSDARIGFNSDDNAVTIVSKETEEFVDITNKSTLARTIIERLSCKCSR